ncbi:nickel/cobalt transporter [Psychromonas sp. L1A2]|uniref:nickel/cobalt transporter n=1 Tax=Psychromonas sp. L1A2 TaxID=2686356 RepID=UPI00191602D2|nr:nickel/cobalt transporter [Psychromonas sp. L1A2]
MTYKIIFNKTASNNPTRKTNSNNESNKMISNKVWLYFASLLFLSTGYVIWQAWPSLIMASMHWQKSINEQIIELLYSAKTELVASGFSLVSLAFIYGVLHSLGPGHGKLIVTTYLATHPTKIKISLILTVLSALLQALVAIIAVSVLLLVFNSTMREVNNEANNLISLSFYSVVILGSIVIWRNAKALFKGAYSRPIPIKITAIKPIINSVNPRNHSNDLNTNNICGCGHVHFASAEYINKASSLKEYLAIIFSVGLRPCTGAIMVLLFSNMLGLYWLGIVSAFLMSVGTALTTSIIAIMTILSTKLVQGYLSSGNNQYKSKKRTSMKIVVKLTGGILLVLMGIILLKSQPIGMSPIL